MMRKLDNLSFTIKQLFLLEYQNEAKEKKNKPLAFIINHYDIIERMLAQKRQHFHSVASANNLSNRGISTKTAARIRCGQQNSTGSKKNVLV